jgi:hypothetical protein
MKCWLLSLQVAAGRGGLTQSAAGTELLVMSKEYHNNKSRSCVRRQFCDGFMRTSITLLRCFYPYY